MPAQAPMLAENFAASARAHPQRPALVLEDLTLTYAELAAQADAIAQRIRRDLPDVNGPRIGVLASKSLAAYAGTLGVLRAGGTVVPLNPGFPARRTRRMIELAGVHGLVVDDAGAALAEHVAGALPAGPRGQPCLWRPDVSAAPTGPAALPAADANALAYLFFTSGSTGVPKGVMVLQRNTARFVQMSLEHYAAEGVPLGPHDRFSQFYDLTFDSSMFDLHVAWAAGACVCSPGLRESINLNKYIEARALTVIDIVPSMGHAMRRGNGWRAGRFGRLRLARFGGEALPAELAQHLARAAPNAMVSNVYGPTECTVDASYYRWDRARSAGEALHGICPIGSAGPGVGLKVVDAQLREVAVGAPGELLISGAQVTAGYLDDPTKTAAAFVRLPGSDAVHYRTGDLVQRPAPGAPIAYLGRLDHQIKIAGVRIDLGEIEAALRRAAGSDEAVAVGWPRTPSGASGIVAFVARTAVDPQALREALKARLPAVMVPREVRCLDALPLNLNGKVDRKALLTLLDAATHGTP